MREIYEILLEVWDYVAKIFVSVKPTLLSIWAVVVSGLNYVLFPDQAYVPTAVAVLIMIITDVITKYYSLGKINGGIVNAFRIGAISSNSFFKGTVRKLLTYMIIMIMAGLSYRVAPIAGVAVLLSNVIYSILFLRECQSVLENFRDAGITEFNWLLDLLKKKEKKILNEKDNNDNDTPTI